MESEGGRDADNFYVEPDWYHALPFHLLKSRISTAIVLSYYDTKKKAVKMTMVLSKSSRAYIITQGYLQGFLLERHENVMSWLFDLKTVPQFREEVSCYLETSEIDKVHTDISILESEDWKVTSLMYVNPSIYIQFLQSTDRRCELEKLYDGVITKENFTWYVIIVLLPMVADLRARKQLL